MMKLFVPALAVCGCLLLVSCGNRDNAPDHPFFDLVKTASPTQVEEALRGNASVKLRNKDGWTPLMEAAAFNPDSEVARFLLEAGSDLDARENGGYTALMIGAKYGTSPGVLALLLAAGASVNEETAEGWTPLLLAARYNPSPDIVRVLLNAGAEVNVSMPRGWTPLTLAAEFTQTAEVVSALLEAGADPQARDNSGKSALDYARLNPHLAASPIIAELAARS